MKELTDYIVGLENIMFNENCEVIEDESCYQILNEITSKSLTDIIDLGLERYYEYFGDSLRVTVNIGTFYSSIFKQEDDVTFILDELRELAKAYEKLQIIVHIDKKVLLQKWLSGTQYDNFRVVVFTRYSSFCEYFEESSVQYLHQKLYNFNKKTLILLPDLEIDCNNGITYILGGNCMDRVYSALNDNSGLEVLEGVLERAETHNKEHSREVSNNYITPEYFYFEEVNNNTIQRLLDYKTIDCSIIYMCDSIKQLDDKYLCVFNGYKTTIVELHKSNHNDHDLVREKTIKVFELYDWTYQSNYLDKIMIVRNIVSKYLKEDCAANYTELINNIHDIFASTQSNYRVFFQEKIDDFFEDRKKIAQYTFDKTKEIEKEINNLTDSIIKNIITAVGVILAAIIAHSNKSDLSLKGIRIAVISYLIYLIISLVYNFITPMISFAQQCNGNDHLLKYYTTFFPKAEVKKIQGNVLDNKKTMFIIYWIFSVVLMLILICLSAYVSNNLESVISNYL